MLKIVFINTVSNSSSMENFVRKGTVILIENARHHYKVNLYPVDANL